MNNEKFQVLYKNTKKEEIIEELYYKCKANNELVSEIERLNKENNILKKNAEHNDKVVDNVNWENMLLKKRIDKAIEYIENYLCSDEYIQSDINSIANAFVKLVDILKGVNKE